MPHSEQARVILLFAASAKWMLFFHSVDILVLYDKTLTQIEFHSAVDVGGDFFSEDAPLFVLPKSSLWLCMRL